MEIIHIFLILCQIVLLTVISVHLLSLTDKYVEFGSYMTLMTRLTDDTFKPTQEIINSAFNKHRLQDFIISTDCLKICELLGTGEM